MARIRVLQILKIKEILHRYHDHQYYHCHHHKILIVQRLKNLRIFCLQVFLGSMIYFKKRYTAINSEPIRKSLTLVLKIYLSFFLRIFYWIKKTDHIGIYIRCTSRGADECKPRGTTPNRTVLVCSVIATGSSFRLQKGSKRIFEYHIVDTSIGL